MDRGHLDEENDIWEVPLLSKSCSYNRDRCPEHPNFCQDYPQTSQTPTPDFVDGGHLGGENDI